MRPYSIRKEDSKYIQPVINNITGFQPSPLALLAATCSRIGDTFHENTATFTHKNLSYEKGRDDVIPLKSCLDTKPNTVAYSERAHDIQQNTSPPFPVATQITSPCFKIKHEENFDFNQNCDGLHTCPNVIAEARMLETQTRVSFSKSCSRDSILTSTCGHIHDSANSNFSFNSSSCEHENMPGQVSSVESSCVYQNSSSSMSSQSSSCALENVNLPVNALSHVPPISQSLQYSTIESYHRSKQDQNSWPNQQQFNRNNLLAHDEKSSCLMHETYATPNHTSQGYPVSTQDRQFRSSLSHMPPSGGDNTFHRSVSQGQTHDSPYFNLSANSPSHASDYHYPNFNMDVKPYNLPGMRQTSSQCLPSNYSTHQPPQEMILHQQHVSPLPSNMPMTQMHNHPPGMPASYCSVCNPHTSNTYIPELVGTSSMQNPDMQSPTLAEYQYQQQQMMFTRDNRRPRRIACTCPNCRDGENKTVTTKDGKQRKLHVCHIPGCGKIYGKTSHLRAHLRWHAGERPFACNWLFCNKRFTRSDELQRHRRTHTGDKRFECSVCLKKFMRSDHLSKHMKTHQTQKQNKDKSDTGNAEKNTSKNESVVKKEDESGKR